MQSRFLERHARIDWQCLPKASRACSPAEGIQLAIIRQCIGHRPAVTDNKTWTAWSGQQLRPGPRAEHDQVRALALLQQPANTRAHHARRRGGYRPRPSAKRIVELGNTNR